MTENASCNVREGEILKAKDDIKSSTTDVAEIEGVVSEKATRRDDDAGAKSSYLRLHDCAARAVCVRVLQ